MNTNLLLYAIYVPLILVLVITLVRTIAVLPVVKENASPRAFQMWVGVITVLFALLIDQSYYFFSSLNLNLELESFIPAIGFTKMLYMAAIGTWSAAIFSIKGVVPRWFCVIVCTIIILSASFIALIVVNIR